jgi:hypothetical protein
MEWEMTTLTRERLPAGASTSGTTGFWALVVAGAATLETPGARSRVLPGDAVLVDARTAHRLTADVETDVVYGDLWRAVPSTALPSPLIVREFRERQVGVVALVMACPLDAKCSKDLFSASYAGLIGAAMSSLWRDDVPGAAGAERGVAGAAVVDAQVAEVVAALAERPGEPWTLDRMAGLVHLSRSALTAGTEGSAIARYTAASAHRTAAPPNAVRQPTASPTSEPRGTPRTVAMLTPNDSADETTWFRPGTAWVPAPKANDQ